MSPLDAHRSQPPSRFHVGLIGAHCGDGHRLRHIELIPKKTYARTEKFADAGFDAMAARCGARPGWTISRSPTGHDLMLDDPANATRILVDAA